MNKEKWGPKIWFILHRLSYFSNRTDVAGAWKNLLVTLSNIMPCPLCRNHMKQYLALNPVDKKLPTNYTGIQFKEHIVIWLYNFHNHVNQSRNKPAYDHTLLFEAYGTRVHVDAVNDAKRVLNELNVDLKDVVSLRSLNQALLYLIGLIGGGGLG